MKFKQTDKITLIGRSGCGKSFLGNKISEIFPRLVIFDSMDEHHPKNNDFVVYDFDQFSNKLKEIKFLELKSWKIIVKIDTSIPDIEEIFDVYMKVLYYYGDCFIVIEEVQDYCTPYFLGRYFKKCMTSGRHQNLGFIFTTQRPALINKTILSQSTHVFVGNLIDRNDARTVSVFIDSEKDEISKLDNFQFLWFTPLRKPHTIKFSSKIIKKIK